MFKEERCSEILRLLRENGFLTVDYLSEKLHYSPATIRRDLVYLARKGSIEKSYGGAAIADIDKRHVLPYAMRKQSFTQEKKKIASLAATLIDENQVVFIDGSTTAAGIIDYIDPRRNITVVTINLENCIKLRERGIRGFCTGGEISSSTPSLSGRLTCDMLSRINMDIMFFASKSLSADGVISEYSESVMSAVTAAMENSSKKVYLTDSSKVGTSSMFNLCTLSDIDTVVSDKDISKKFRQKFKNVTFLF
ncbi:MAG: DeoR/GlpR transcriptional regulator [Clostridia bacterium]|nr:DeoR/GlpR transcriptional regulator [Clostridia bacterium]